MGVPHKPRNCHITNMSQIIDLKFEDYSEWASCECMERRK